jgi:predicted permease
MTSHLNDDANERERVSLASGAGRGAPASEPVGGLRRAKPPGQTMMWLSRLALWVHERSLARHERDAVIGDLVEELDIRARTDPGAAAAWAWMQTVRSIVPNLRRRLLDAPITPATESAHGGHMLNGFSTDLRFAVRQLMRQPLTTVVGLVSLTAGLGLNILMFTLADAALFRPLPLRDPSGLVLLLLQRETNLNHNLSYPEYRDLRDNAHALEGLVAYGAVEATMAGSAGAAPIDGEVVSGNFFSVLGVPLRAGRELGTADDRAGSAPAVVISEQLWRDRLGSAPPQGQAITLSGVPYTVVGVASRAFSGMQVGRRASFWIAIAHTPLLVGEDNLERPTASWLTVVGRLRDGVPIAAARNELDAVLTRVRQGARRPLEPVVLQPGGRGDSQLAAQIASPLQLLMIAGALVLVVACLNVANLQLVRTDARRIELTVRAALGARRAQLVRLVMIDAVVMAALAGTAGVWLAALVKEPAASLIAFYGRPVSLNVPLDLRVVAAAMGFSALAAFIIGGLSAWKGLRGPSGLTADTRAGSTPYRATQRALVVAQMALAMALLMGGALLVRTLDRLRHTDLGFDPRGVVVASVSPEMGRLTRDKAMIYFDDAIRAASSLPGVRSAAVAHVMPLDFGGSRTSIEIAGYTPAKDEDMELNFVRVTPDYFKTLGIRLLQGRPFDERDRDGQPERIIVNETMARRFWPDGRVVGRFVRFGSQQPFNVEVVGVVPDAHHRMVREDPAPSFYVPLAQWPRVSGVLHVRFADTRPDLDAARIGDVRRAIAAVNPGVPVLAVHTLADQVERNLADDRMTMTIGTTLGGVAVLLATAGLYATMAFLVGRRTREIGVRMALGAATADVRRLVLREGVLSALAGVAGGLALSIWVGRALQSRLYGVGAFDVVSLTAAAATLVAAALVASWLPARRASRVDPVVALRE